MPAPNNPPNVGNLSNIGNLSNAGNAQNVGNPPNPLNNSLIPANVGNPPVAGAPQVRRYRLRADPAQDTRSNEEKMRMCKDRLFRVTQIQKGVTPEEFEILWRNFMLVMEDWPDFDNVTDMFLKPLSFILSPATYADLDAHRMEIQSWDAAKRKIQQYFGFNDSEAKSREAYANRRQRVGESVATFHQSLRALAIAAGQPRSAGSAKSFAIDFETKLLPKLRIAVRRRRTNDDKDCQPEIVLQRAIEEEENMADEEALQEVVGAFNAKVQNLEAEINRLQTCYSCGKPGHKRQDCRNNKRSTDNNNRRKDPNACWNCGKIGHMRRDCRSNRPASENSNGIKRMGTPWSPRRN